MIQAVKERTGSCVFVCVCVCVRLRACSGRGEGDGSFPKAVELGAPVI